MNKLTLNIVNIVRNKNLVSNKVIDDLMVDALALDMKEKLAEKRAEGYRGWHLYMDCNRSFLLTKLNKQLERGDMVDVMNLAAMIHIRHELYGHESN